MGDGCSRKRFEQKPLSRRWGGKKNLRDLIDFAFRTDEQMLAVACFVQVEIVAWGC